MKIATLLTALVLATPAAAWDYNLDVYPGYGYASAASTLNMHELKGGLRGSHVETTKEDIYYPGFATGNPFSMFKH